jgi:diaminopimelate decarboxylase
LRDIVVSECERLNLTVPHLSVEPGRAIIGRSTITLYEVGTIKPIDLDGGVQRLYVSVDGGMSDNIRTALYDAQYTARVVNRVPYGEPVQARIVGKHCESGDIVVKDLMLPSDVVPGDLIAVAATGAYHRSMASNYNMVARPSVISVNRGVAQTLIRRETTEDLLRLDEGISRRSAR